MSSFLGCNPSNDPLTWTSLQTPSPLRGRPGVTVGKPRRAEKSSCEGEQKTSCKEGSQERLPPHALGVVNQEGGLEAQLFAWAVADRLTRTRPLQRGALSSMSSRTTRRDEWPELAHWSGDEEGGLLLPVPTSICGREQTAVRWVTVLRARRCVVFSRGWEKEVGRLKGTEFPLLVLLTCLLYFIKVISNVRQEYSRRAEPVTPSAECRSPSCCPTAKTGDGVWLAGSSRTEHSHETRTLTRKQNMTVSRKSPVSPHVTAPLP